MQHTVVRVKNMDFPNLNLKWTLNQKTYLWECPKLNEWENLALESCGRSNHFSFNLSSQNGCFKNIFGGFCDALLN